jgi:hypothetical protein
MTAKAESIGEELVVKRYKIAYPASKYTFPREALIHDVRIDDTYIHVDLTDGRIPFYPTVVDSICTQCTAG